MLSDVQGLNQEKDPVLQCREIQAEAPEPSFPETDKPSGCGFRRHVRGTCRRR